MPVSRDAAQCVGVSAVSSFLGRTTLAGSDERPCVEGWLLGRLVTATNRGGVQVRLGGNDAS
jgi:hypothetical protein